jgi:hypothetical protein
MPHLKIDDLAAHPSDELTSEQMNSLLGGTSELAKDPLSDDFCGTTPASPFNPLHDLGSRLAFDPTRFPWNREVPSGPAGPCGPSALIAG